MELYRRGTQCGKNHLLKQLCLSMPSVVDAPVCASHAVAACEILRRKKWFENAACIARVSCTRACLRASPPPTPSLFLTFPLFRCVGRDNFKRWDAGCATDRSARGCMRAHGNERVRACVGGCVLSLIICGSTGTAFYRAGCRLTYILNDAVVRYISCDWARSSEPSASSSCPRRVTIVRVCISVWANIGQVCVSGLVEAAEDMELQKETEDVHFVCVCVCCGGACMHY